MQEHATINRWLAILVFTLSLILYTLTLAPTASFWDAGEFIAVANGLQVTHPPGAPFYLLLGRLFSMFSSPLWVAYSVNMLSAVVSAGTILLLYLIIVRLVREWKGHPDAMDVVDRMGMYAGGAVGALTFAVTDTFWFNAVEAEVYALSMFFTALTVWLPLKWAEVHDQPRSERWLLLIAYLFGLALGVHLLNVLAIFYVALIIYFKKHDFQVGSFLIMSVLAVLAFGLIYPFTVVQIPSIAQAVDEATYGLLGPVGIFVLIFALVGLGIWYTQKNKMKWLNVAFLAYGLILIGYSSYALVFIRSAVDPPIDENDPETVEALVSYLKREQYGSTPILKGNTFDNATGTINRQKEVFFPRRYSQEGRHLRKYAQYDSDWDYFWSYQVTHMYIRYFNWNFVGRESDVQDTGWRSGFESGESPYSDNRAHNAYYFLPFLLGLFGVFFHFQKDWRRALAVMALFMLTGFAIIVFLNQYPYQPRERDYAYVGSYFAFAIWIGLGAAGLIDLIKEYLGDKAKIPSIAASGILFAAVPLLMLSENYDDHDRSLRYVAPDYAYNLLNSVAPYGIVFTNGDNDTFPLWYLQEVEGVRTDVRVVCLSLLNTPWYIKQLKNQWSHESPPLPISYTDEEIDRIEEKFQFRKADDFWTPKTIRIPVDKSAIKKHHQLPEGKQEPTKDMKALGMIDVFSPKMHFNLPADSLDDEISWYLEGRALSADRYYTLIQDDVILDMLQTNNWIRPIYFAITVAYDGQLNLQKYFRLEGQAFRVVPKRNENAGAMGWVNPAIHGNTLSKFRFREVNNPQAYFDENIRRMLDNYRTMFTRQATAYMELGKPDSAAYWLRWGEEKIPFEVIEADPTTEISYAFRYANAGAVSDALRMVDKLEGELVEDFAKGIGQLNRIEEAVFQLDAESKLAQQSADYKKAQQLRSRIQNVLSGRQQAMEEISFARTRLLLVQRILFLAEEDKRAQQLAATVIQLSEDRLPFPEDEASNLDQVERIRFE